MEKYRVRILQLIYQEQKRNQLNSVDSEQLVKKLGSSWDQIRGEITYLQEKKYIIIKNNRVGTRIFNSIQITSLGIDFLEGKNVESTHSNISFKIQLNIKNEKQFEARVINQTPMGEPYCISQLPFSNTELKVILKALSNLKVDLISFTQEEIEILKKVGLQVDSQFVPDFLTHVGQILYNSLMAGDLDIAFQMSLNLSKPTKSIVEIQLRFDENATDLVQYPWELLFHRRALLPSGTVEITRYISYPEAVTRLPVTPPIQLLYIQSRPTNLKFLDTSEQEITNKVFVKLEEENLFKIHNLIQPSYEALLNYLETNGIHILHFDGHGVFAWKCPKCGAMNYPNSKNCQSKAGKTTCNQTNNSIKSKGYLAFEQEDSRVDWISSEELSYLFNKYPLRLAVLSACRSGSVGGESLFSGTAPSLIQAGVPAVLSTQLPISVSVAARFMLGFYSALGRLESLPAAVNAGRLRIVRTNEWFIPTLYLRSQDNNGFLFSTTQGDYS